MPDEADYNQVEAELKSIVAAVEQITGLKVNWNGILYLESSIREKGSKSFRCHIVVRADLAGLEVRWRTLLHEVLHAASVGYNFPDFSANRGWEEGVVEQLQRLVRPQILSVLNVDIKEAVFAEVEEQHLFNTYIEPLERIRNALQEEPQTFYVALLQTPIKARYASLIAKANTRSGAERIRLIRVLAEANVVLTRRFTD